MTLVLVTTPVGATIGTAPTATSSFTTQDTDPAVAAATQQKLTKCQEIDSSGTYVLSGNIDADQSSRSFCIHVTASSVRIKGSGTLSNGDIKVGGPNTPPLSDVTVRNINVDDGRITFNDVTTVVVKGTTISGSQSSAVGLVHFTDVTDAEITDNQFTGRTDRPPDGIRIETTDGGGGSSDIRIADNDLSGLNVGVLFFGSGRDDAIQGVTITGNRIENNVELGPGVNQGEGGHGIEIRTTADPFAESTWAEDVTITDNTIRSNGVDGIRSNSNTVDLTISNNRVTQNGADGISVGSQNTTGTTIRNNRVTGNGVTGIVVGGNHTIVTGNNASGNGYGISISGRNATVTDNTVNRNEFPSAGSIGMEIHGTGHTIANNTVNGNRQGIHLAGSRSTLRNNIANGNVERGIEIAGDNHTIVGNTAINNTGPGSLGGGINLLDRATDNLLRDNTVRNNTWGLILHPESLDHPGQVTNTIERLHLGSGTTSTTISFSEGSVSGDTNRQLRIKAVENPPDDPATLQNISKYVNVTPISGIVPPTPSGGHINLTVHYTPGETRINESSLRMWRFNEFIGSSDWSKADEYNRVDPEANTVTGNVSLSGHTIVAPLGERPCRADDDGDGLCNRWETTGIDVNNDGEIDLNLSKHGADPQRKDIFVEIDYMDCAQGGCAAGDMHDHRPEADALQRVKRAFANAPVQNPDGSTGITLHVVVDEPIREVTPIRFGGDIGIQVGATPAGTTFDDLKLGNPRDPCGTAPSDAHFGTVANRTDENCRNITAARRLVFHYAIYGHNHTHRLGSSGIAELPGNDFMVTLWQPGYRHLANTLAGRWGTSPDAEWDILEAGTFMHELGHNFGLKHGGDNLHRNRKPNYLSIMNYAFQWNSAGRARDIPGVADGTPVRTHRPLTYSASSLPTLDETALDEGAGINGPARWRTRFWNTTNHAVIAPASGAIDWNTNGTIDSDVTVDVNNDGGLDRDLEGHDDWATLDYNFRDEVDFGKGSHQSASQVTEQTDDDYINASFVEPDVDNDGAANAEDNCPLAPNPSQSDANDDGSGDACTVVRLSPAAVNVSLSGSTQLALVVGDVGLGVGGLNVTVRVGNDSAASITGANVTHATTNETVAIQANGSQVDVVASGMNTPDTTDVSVLTLTLNGTANGSTSAEPIIHGLVSEQATRYAVTGPFNATVTVRPSGGGSAYAGENGLIETDELRRAISDWVRGEIGTARLRDLIQAWVTRAPV